jgi:zinc protease
MKKLFLMAALVLASVTSSFAQFNPYEPIPADPEVRTGVLENGITYYIRHNAKPENRADFYIFHNVGAIQEEDNQQGLAHFTEHMAFNGTKNFPDKGIIEWCESIGVKFGADINAATGMEMTFYHMDNVPLTRESIIDTALLVLHDWSYFISMLPEEIDKERGVIVEELRTHQGADWRVGEKSRAYLFGDSKYTQRNLIGSEEGLKSFSYQDIKDFYHRWYRTDLQAVVVVGDFDVDAMEAKIKATMADIPAVENPEEKTMYFIPENEEPIVGIVTDPELTESSVSFYIKRDSNEPEINNTMIVELTNLMDNLLGAIANERLRDISQKPNAPFTYASIGSGSLVDTHDAVFANAGAREGETLQAFEALYTEAEKIARYGFTESELERAKENLLRRMQQAYDRRDDRRNGEFPWTYMDNFKSNTPMPSAEKEYEIDKMLLDLIDLQTINAFVQQGRFLPDNQVIIITAPEKEGVSVPTEAEVNAVIEKVRTAEIEAPVDNTVKEPLIPEGTKLKGSKVSKTATDKFGATEWTLKNGVKIVVKPTDFKADEIILSATSMGGTSNLPVEMLASADLYSGYMSQAGIGKFSASDLRKQLSGKAVSVGVSLSPYSNGFYGSASPKDLETMMQLLYLNFTSPRYDESDYGVLIDRVKTQYLNMASNPMFALQENLMNSLYDNNPRRQTFNYDRISEAKFSDMQAIHDALFSRAADFTFTFVGNINMDEFKPLVEKYLGSLPKSKKTLNWVDDGVRQPKGVVENRFEFPMEAPKTTVAYVYNGQIPYTMENELKFETLSQILSTRYLESIREEKGGTYGVAAYSQLGFTPVDNYILIVNFDTNPEMADELMAIVSLEIETIAKDGVRADDLAKVKEYMAKTYPDNIKQNSYWSSVIGTYHLAGFDFDSGYMDAVNAITSEDLQALAQQILKDNNLVKVIMDPAPAVAE